MEKKASAILSAYSFISTYSPDEIVLLGYQIKNGTPIPSFEENLLIELCSEALNIFKNEENHVEINGDVIIVGDIHGSLHDLLRILKYTVEKEIKILFLGDYVDRGNFSLECITLLFALKVMYPDEVFLLRGNHEFDSICSQYGFKSEILNSNILKISNCYTYTEALYNAFIDAFSYLPISALVNHTTFCVHGGLSPELSHINDINRKIKRPIKSINENSLLNDLLWSDPSNFNDYPFEESPRGYGYLFNHEAVDYFLKCNSISRIIRAHQVAQNGIMKYFDEKCITVFSISSYKESLNNSSAILQIYQENDSMKATIFHPLNRLSKNDAFFTKYQPPIHLDTKNRVFFTLFHPVLNSNVSGLPINKNARPIKLRRNIPMISASTPKFVTNNRKSCSRLNKSPMLHGMYCSE